MKKRFVEILLFAVTVFSILLVSCKDNNESILNESDTENISSEKEYTAQDYYADALTFIDSGNYTQAYSCLQKCDGYEDSEELLKDFKIVYEKEFRTIYDKNGDIAEKQEYDKNGNRVGSSIYHDDGTLIYTYVYEYDEYGNMTVDSSYDNKGKLRLKYIYNREYDSDGNMTRETKIDSEDGAIVGDFGYEYDSDGKVTTLFLLDSGTKVEYKYDEHGNQISSVSYYSNGNIVTHDFRGYSYDEKGRIVCESSCLATGEVTRKTEYEYDANGNVTHEIYTDGEGNIGKEEEYSYDENGNMTRHLSYYRGIVRRRIEYDTNGTVISDLSFDQDGNVSGEIKYEYSNPTVVYSPTAK